MIKIKSELLFILFAMFLFSACKKGDKNHNINFYYWKTNVTIGETEKKYFDKLDCEKLYIRFFDIDYEPKNGYPTPKATIRLFNPKILDTKYVPVVFITNRTFLDMGYWNPEDLAHRTNSLINDIVKKNNIPEIEEIQIDCDWTGSTREKYFSYLNTLKELSGKNITSTLRLHQVKDKEQTGIPPVDKVYLMCYATASPKDADTQNSILDINLLKNYTKNIDKYPLDFDVALPLYSWGVVTNHRGEIKLINNVDISGLVPEFFEKTGKNTYKALDDFILQGIYLNKDFTLRIERIEPALLNEAKSYLDGKLNKNYNIVYYHLDKSFIERFTIDELK